MTGATETVASTWCDATDSTLRTQLEQFWNDSLTSFKVLVDQVDVEDE